MTLQRSFLRFSVALGCVALLVACSSSDPHKPKSLVKFTQTVKLEKVWSTSCGEGLTGLLTPAVTENGIFAAGKNRLYRINPETGDTVWEVKTNGDVVAGVGSDGTYAAIGNANGEVEVFDNEGKRLWKVRLTSEMNVPPLVGSGFVIVRTTDTRITAFDAATGERRWRYQGQQKALTLRTASQMRFSPAGVLVGQANGRLLALGSNGTVVFDIPVAQAKGITEVDRMVDVVGAPWVDDHMMCAASYQGNVLCISSSNGSLVWRTPVNAVSGPVTDGQLMYVMTTKGEVVALNYETGRTAWTSSDYLRRLPSGGAILNGYLTFGDYDGEIHVLDPKTGLTVGRTSISGAIKVPPIVCEGGVLYQSAKGKLALFKLIEEK